MTSDSVIDSLRAGKIDDLGLIRGGRVMWRAGSPSSTTMYESVCVVLGNYLLRHDAPLRSRIAPLAHSASADARYTTAAATSPVVPTRPKGLCPRISSPPGPARMAAAMSVSTNPGATVLTAMPWWPRARASDWPSAFRPALLAA